jgi:hypothetical protein
MDNLTMNHDLSVLFSNEVPLRPFTTSNVSDIPSWGSIIYTVFLDKTEYIYVGIGGLSGKSVTERNPRSRIMQHSQGRRSGDQFCIYIQDFYVIPELIGSKYTPKKGYLDLLTKQFIQSRLTYRYLVVQTDDSDQVVRQLEREIQRDQYGYGVPLLNGISK